MKKQKEIVKLANFILTALMNLNKARLTEIRSKLENICYRSSQASRDSHRFFASLDKKWFHAAEHVKEKISRDMRDFSYHLSRFLESINCEKVRIPTLADIVSELLSIEQELEKFNFDLSNKTISVTTKPITLEDVFLGPFEIKLQLDKFDDLYSERPYKVIALDPHPAGSDDNVTHPHVSHESLCEGDGCTAIGKALEQGRLCDFFTMVIGILENYNPSSPYVSLDDWSGYSCYDCGCTICDDERYYCDICDNDYCGNCSSYCQKCDSTVCLGCAYECPGCGELVCSSCTAVCMECDTKYCKDCLCEGICQNCEEQRKEQDEDDQEITEEPQTDTEIQSDGVGEAAVVSRHDG